MKICKHFNDRRLIMKSFGCPTCFFLNHDANVDKPRNCAKLRA